MDIKNNILAIDSFLEDANTNSIIIGIAGRVKRTRLEQNLTQQAMAKRAGVSFASYRRFESTGEVSLRSLVKIAVTLNATEEFFNLFTKKQYQNLDQVIAGEKIQTKIRGRKND